jgi:hypothetical protein
MFVRLDEAAQSDKAPRFDGTAFSTSLGFSAKRQHDAGEFLTLMGQHLLDKLNACAQGSCMYVLCMNVVV